MKFTILFSLLAFQTSLLSAQQTERTQNPSQNKTRELGIFGQTAISSGNETISFLGIQYKKWKTAHFGYRIIGAYGDYNNFGYPYFIGSQGDTSIERRTNTNISLGILGAGVEAQRIFYKRVVLFAAMEIRGGYGSGLQDSNIVKNSRNTANGYYYSQTSLGSSNESMYYIGFSPSIGAKLQFRHINFGVEVSGINTSFTGLKVKNSERSSSSNMSMGEVSSRFFINYNF